MVDAPLDEIKTFVSEMEDREKESKRREIEAYFFRRSGVLGGLAARVLNSPAFFEAKWLNKTTSAKTWQTAVDAKITRTAWDLNSIQTTAGPHAGAVTANVFSPAHKSIWKKPHKNAKKIVIPPISVYDNTWS